MKAILKTAGWLFLLNYFPDITRLVEVPSLGYNGIGQ
jgi:hypothetical protein